MPARVSHVFKIIMFAACPNAFLRTGCPYVISLFFSQKSALKLHHTSIGKKQGRVMHGYQRGTLCDRMASLLKIFQEFPSQIIR